jgi:Coenzyme PQQ synthesis protein D (PqqD)
MAYQISADKILHSQVGEEGVVFDLEKNDYITLNETFYKILQGIEAGKTQAAIVSDLCVEYAISETDCSASVDRAIGELVQKGFVKAA